MNNTCVTQFFKFVCNAEFQNIFLKLSLSKIIIIYYMEFKEENNRYTVKKLFDLQDNDKSVNINREPSKHLYSQRESDPFGITNRSFTNWISSLTLCLSALLYAFLVKFKVIPVTHSCLHFSLSCWRARFWIYLFDFKRH